MLQNCLRFGIVHKTREINWVGKGKERERAGKRRRGREGERGKGGREREEGTHLLAINGAGERTHWAEGMCRELLTFAVFTHKQTAHSYVQSYTHTHTHTHPHPHPHTHTHAHTHTHIHTNTDTYTARHHLQTHACTHGDT